MASTRSRSVPYTPASSSRDISASRWSAKKCCGSRRGWATRTRGSSDGLPRSVSSRVTASRRRVSGDSAVAYSWAYCQALEGLAGCTIPPRGSVAARPDARGRAHRQSSRGPGRAGQRRGLRLRPRAVLAAQGTLVARDRGALRATLPDGRDRARRHCASMSRQMRCSALSDTPDNWPTTSARCGRSTRNTTACATGSRRRAACHRRSPPGLGSSDSRGERAARRTTPASIGRPRHTMR